MWVAVDESTVREASSATIAAAQLLRPERAAVTACAISASMPGSESACAAVELARHLEDMTVVLRTAVGQLAESLALASQSYSHAERSVQGVAVRASGSVTRS